ncbi:mannitol-1-phosphate 5-dehydrogenase [Paenibacillus hodogayensis]|uniref:Mannitol-1-phosphate 5-dehydrogenase n=1 Tax=Paenibacillus hodogayensis TaxID=279208 RepID=A0ABV5VPD3_9BACL
MRSLHFGAGNIGRGFIGLILSQAGYEVCFSDVNSDLVRLLQEKRAYTVRLANAEQQTFRVEHVTAIHGNQLEAVAEAVAQADIVTTAVGVGVLKHIAEGIARGLELRLERGGAPLQLIACENAIGGSTQLKERVFAHLSGETLERVNRMAVFPDAAVDRIVPIQHNEDPLEVRVEPFYEWVVDESQLFPGFRRIEGIHYVDRLEPYIERKLFTVNTGHCAAAYFGYLRGIATIQETLADAELRRRVRGVMEETGALLIDKYGFDAAEHARYIDKILERFVNPYLTDEVARVGRSPIRKLSADDRLVRPALQAFERGLPVEGLVWAMAAALHFDHASDPEAANIQADLANLGLSRTIANYTSIEPSHPLHEAIRQAYEAITAAASS